MAQSTIIEAGLGMEQILEKIKIYSPRQTVAVRVRSVSSFAALLPGKRANGRRAQGMQYAVGDFVVKVGSIMLGETTRGVLLEVEYRPCMVPNACTQILQSFASNLGILNTSFFPPTTNYAGARRHCHTELT